MHQKHLNDTWQEHAVVKATFNLTLQDSIFPKAEKVS